MYGELLLGSIRCPAVQKQTLHPAGVVSESIQHSFHLLKLEITGSQSSRTRSDAYLCRVATGYELEIILPHDVMLRWHTVLADKSSKNAFQ